MIPIAPPADQHGVVKERVSRYPGAGWGISSQCKDPVTVIKFMDYFFSEEGDELINWGIEGDTYTKNADGTKQFTDKVLKSEPVSYTHLHVLTFVFAPMVHWPEVMVTYDSRDKVLFSADGFGKFGAMDVEEDWDDEARRYYIGIVGKYGVQVQNLLKAAASLDIQTICPLHGPVLKENLGHYIKKYQIWSSYAAESEGVMIAYTSVYGNTKKAVELLAGKLREKGCPQVVVCDLARTAVSYTHLDVYKRQAWD